MSIKLNQEKNLTSKDYVYTFIIYNKDIKCNKIQEGITSLIKSFLQFFSIKNIKSLTIGKIIHGEFKPNGVISYWLKYRCKTIIINSLPYNQIKTLIDHCRIEDIPIYENYLTDKKTLANVCIGPYWTNKLIKIHPIIKNKLEEIIE